MATGQGWKVGTLSGEFRLMRVPFDEGDSVRRFLAALGFLCLVAALPAAAARASGRINPIVDSTYDLVDLPDALKRHAAGDARGKILISVDRS